MKNLRNLTLFLMFIMLSCSGDDDCPIADNLDLFNELWKTFDHEYAAFEILDKDWDAIKDKYSPLVDNNTTEQELYEVFKAVLFELEDAHSDLHTESDLGSVQYYYEVTDKASRNYIGWSDLQTKYLENVIESTQELAYAKIQNEDIGYLRLRTFSGDPADFDLMDGLLSSYSNLKGIIIDVRNNDGGNEANAKEIASNFVDKETLYRYARLKEGCERNKLSGFRSLEMNAHPTNHFAGKVILLTNKKTFSAGEDFTLMMKATPNIVHIGDDTWGGFATGPSSKKLSNGWRFRVSKKISYDLDKNPIIGGIKPDEKIVLSENDMDNNVDRIIERAIEILDQ